MITTATVAAIILGIILIGAPCLYWLTHDKPEYDQHYLENLEYVGVHRATAKEE